MNSVPSIHAWVITIVLALISQAPGQLRRVIGKGDSIPGHAGLTVDQVTPPSAFFPRTAFFVRPEQFGANVPSEILLTDDGTQITAVAAQGSRQPETEDLGPLVFKTETPFVDWGDRVVFHGTFAEGGDAIYSWTPAGIRVLVRTGDIAGDDFPTKVERIPSAIYRDQRLYFTNQPEGGGGATGIFSQSTFLPQKRTVIEAGDIPPGLPRPFTHFSFQIDASGGRLYFEGTTSDPDFDFGRGSGTYLVKGLMGRRVPQLVPITTIENPIRPARPRLEDTYWVKNGPFLGTGETAWHVTGIIDGEIVDGIAFSPPGGKWPDEVTMKVKVGDADLLTPGGGWHFSQISSPAVTRWGYVGFAAASVRPSGETRWGIYTGARLGQMVKVVDSEMLADEGAVSWMEISRYGWDGRRLAFSAHFEDGTSALYALQYQPGWPHYWGWILDRFPDLSPQEAAPDQDLDLDGLNNFVEFALGGHPQEPDIPDLLPQLDIGDNERIEIRIQRRRNIENVALVVPQATTTLNESDWKGESEGFLEQVAVEEEADGETETVRYRTTAAVGDANRLFVRLRVVSP